VANSARSYHPPLAARLVELAELRPNMAVLDVACGTGLVLLAAAAEVGPIGRAVGVDISAEMLKQVAHPGFGPCTY
jgi:ubiquinone/menaquinone biosynthesis C-methylase UbiE